MSILKILSVFVLALAFGTIAMAEKNAMGIHEVSRVTFVAPMRVGTVLLPAGNYVVRHNMEGTDHVMVFQRVPGNDEFKVKCTLVPLVKKADQNQTIYQLNAGNERQLQELIFRGDTAKHVF